MVHQWDYMTLEYPSGEPGTNIKDDLQSWGGRGWELVSVVQTLSSSDDDPSKMWPSGLVLFMKRPL